MKNFDFKKLLPHAVAVGIFLLVTLIYCSPALKPDTVLKQSDIASWEAMSHQSFEYKEKNGHFPLWVSTMFGGMPAYQIALDGIWTPIGYVDKLFQLWLPKPMNFFFLMCISFYFLCMSLRIRPYASILGALAFAFCSYTPICITAGHDTKMLALAYVPALMGGVILIFDKKYLTGFVLTALFTTLQIAQGHQQISYYAFIILFIMIAFFIGNAILKKQTEGLVKTLGAILVAAIIGVAANAISLFPTYDYVKYSKRGGQLKIDDGKNKEATEDGKTKGMSKEYAFQWSYGKAETMSLIFPGVKGYGLYYAQRDQESYLYPLLKDDSKVVSYFTEKFPQAAAQSDQIAQQMSQSLYWGDMPFTNGPVYIGAAIFFLFLLGMFMLDDKHKWWILSASIFAILLSLGHNLDGFNTFFYNHLPLYNKFRVPTMAMVIPQVLFPIVASLVLNKLWDSREGIGLNNDEETNIWKKFKMASIIAAVVLLVGGAYYASSDFGVENTQRTAAFNKLVAEKPADFQAKYAEINNTLKAEKDNQVYENWFMQLQQNPEATSVARGIVGALKADRASFMMSSLVNAFIYMLLTALIILLFIKKKINALLMVIAVTTIASIDVIMVGGHYLTEKSFDSKDNYAASEFPMSDADKTILADKDPNYRVFNTTVGSPFEDAKTSYYHKSIGGYHAAKLGIYEDISTYQINGRPNPAVLNMLNAKWIIMDQDKKSVAIKNPNALGNAWFVKGINFVKGSVAEMKALDNLNTKDSAVLQDTEKLLVTNFTPADSTSSIVQTKYDNDAISYESNAKANHFAVFSEVYYKDWNAYIDGAKVPVIKANYVLRALMVPAGKHNIDFKFEPSTIKYSKLISGVAGWVLTILLVLALALNFKKKNEV